MKASASSSAALAAQAPSPEETKWIAANAAYEATRTTSASGAGVGGPFEGKRFEGLTYRAGRWTEEAAAC